MSFIFKYMFNQSDGTHLLLFRCVSLVSIFKKVSIEF